jgi:hypothetical protein
MRDYDRVLFGQPVRYGNKSFIRIALGASDLRHFVVNGADYTCDDTLVSIIEETVKARF